MPTHKETVEEHPLWQDIQQVKEALEQDFPDDDAVVDVLARARTVLETVEGRGEHDPHLISKASIDKVDASVKTLVGELNLLADNPQYEQQVTNRLDEVLVLLASWPPAKPHRLIGGVKASSDEHVKRLGKRVSQFQSEMDEAGTATREELDALRAEHIKLTEKYEALLADVAETKSQADHAVGELAEAFETAQKGWDEAAKAQRDAVTTENGKAHERWRDDAEAELGVIKQMAKDAGLVVESLAEKETADHYRAYADEQRQAARKWNWLTVGMLLLLVVAVAWALDGLETVTWHASVLRFGVTLTGLAVAAYCGAQATGHRREERRARRYQHGLSSVGAFLANVEPERRNLVRSLLATQLFQGDPVKGLGDTPSLSEQAARLLAPARDGKRTDNPETPGPVNEG